MKESWNGSCACTTSQDLDPRLGGSNWPYIVQGTVQAVEDAAALVVLLSTISTRREIPQGLQAYQISRKQRADTVQQSGSENRIALHLADGAEQITMMSSS
ncbi:uncharacterized protein N7459_001417 [Penicillium hispanicum]|uniref:uncharacterized protein n=1 Tax=Penicillium hispanicum TaxID=1080232 RepID=UPI002541A8B8|nr:uncharacterized protein N7459_001417 [Penicillium hispanicum]KAJ5595209.1 hypothetical protein N7459_001417 [Penicillium hispanicum]